MKRLALAASAAVLSVVLASCSSSANSSSSNQTSGPPAPPVSSVGAPPASSGGAPSSGAPAADTAQITIDNFAFSGTMTVKPGEKVTVINKDSVAHTLTDKKNHKFDTGNIDGGGGTGTFTAPTTPGSYEFGCNYHPNMKGTLVVQG